MLYPRLNIPFAIVQFAERCLQCLSGISAMFVAIAFFWRHHPPTGVSTGYVQSLFCCAFSQCLWASPCQRGVARVEGTAAASWFLGRMIAGQVLKKLRGSRALLSCSRQTWSSSEVKYQRVNCRGWKPGAVERSACIKASRKQVVAGPPMPDLSGCFVNTTDTVHPGAVYRWSMTRGCTSEGS